jgi:hypothetical protein
MNAVRVTDTSQPLYVIGAIETQSHMHYFGDSTRAVNRLPQKNSGRRFVARLD